MPSPVAAFLCKGYRACVALLAINLWLAACSDPSPTNPATLADDATALEILGSDIGSLANTQGPDGELFSEDTAAADTQDASDQDLYDSGWADDLGAGLPFDVAQPDTPTIPLTVLSTSPKNDDGISDSHAVFSVVFSHPINEQTIADYTLLVNGPGGVMIPGTDQTQGGTLSFTSDAALPPSSRVDVTITIQVQDLKGRTLAEAYSFHFHTAGYPNTAPYAALARRYAPDIRQGLGATAPADDLLRPLDFDGDWNALNNEANTTQFEARAAIGWAVAETQSHFFIHYVFSWPRRPKATAQTGYDNDTAGATVIVRRYPSEQPIALETWFKHGPDERKWLFVTSDSGLVPAGKSPGSVNVRAVLPLDALFPKATDTLGCDGVPNCTPRRFLAYLTGGSHQSCLWSAGGDKTVCATDAYHKTKMSLIHYVIGLKATSATAKGATPGAALPTFAYVLTPLFETWFARRTSADLFVAPMTFTYKAPVGRPTGQKVAIGSKFVGGGSDFGRPPWAWRWKPANNSSYYALPRGTVFFDPAFALWQRVGGGTAGLKPFDAKAKTGISLAYCFAPFLFIDQRSIAACKSSLPSPAP